MLPCSQCSDIVYIIIIIADDGNDGPHRTNFLEAPFRLTDRLKQYKSSFLAQTSLFFIVLPLQLKKGILY